MAKENEKYNGTINLPKPLLPMKANLPQTEETWLKFWEDDNVFEKALEKRKNSPLFILHDGPPYANGDIHLGTCFAVLRLLMFLGGIPMVCPSSSR